MLLNKLRLLTPGPTPLPEEVRLAMARDMIHHRKAAFKALMAEVQAGLKVLFGTAQTVLPLTTSGSGAMSAAVFTLFASGEKLLVVQAGKFGQRFGEIARARGLETAFLTLPWGASVPPEAVAEALDADPAIRGVLVQASETSTGALHPIQQIAAVTRERPNILLVVDGVSAVGISPCPMDEWGIDCLLTGSQKGLMLPPGLALIALSARAWDKAEAVASSAAGGGEWTLDLRAELANAKKNQTRFTSPVSLIVGLAESLKLFLAEGLENVHRKQRALSRMTLAGIEAMGLEPFATDMPAWGLTSVKLPAGIDGQKLLEIAADTYGVMFAGGQDEYKGCIVRIGHMGYVDWGDLLAGLTAFHAAFIELGGCSPSRDFPLAAMQAYRRALGEAPILTYSPRSAAQDA